MSDDLKAKSDLLRKLVCWVLFRRMLDLNGKCCLFYMQPCSGDERHPDRSDFGRCSYKEFHEVLFRHLEGSTGDKAALLQNRFLTLSNYSDIFTAEACYRRLYMGSFNIESLENNTPTPVRGTPVRSKEGKIFETLCEWLEVEVELYAEL